MKHGESKIVADGGVRLYEVTRRRIQEEVTHRYAEELRTASFWRRLWLEMKVRRAVKEALGKKYSSQNLYFGSAAPNLSNCK